MLDDLHKVLRKHFQILTQSVILINPRLLRLSDGISIIQLAAHNHHDIHPHFHSLAFVEWKYQEELKQLYTALNVLEI